MSRSIALLTISAFTLSAPLNAHAFVSTSRAEETVRVVDAPIDSVRSECDKKSDDAYRGVEATGALPDTAEAPVNAHITGCCWTFWQGRWWCFSC